MNHIDPSDKTGLYAFIFSMAFVLVFMFYLSFIYEGVKIDVPQNPVESTTADEDSNEE